MMSKPMISPFIPYFKDGKHFSYTIESECEEIDLVDQKHTIYMLKLKIIMF